MNSFEIDKKGLFFFESGREEDFTIAGIFPFNQANDESDFLKITRDAISQNHDFIFVVNNSATQYFSNGLTMGIKLNKDAHIHAKTILGWKDCFRTQDPTICYRPSRYTLLVEKALNGSLLEYEIDFQEFAEELSKMWKITGSCEFIAGFFSPAIEKNTVKSLKILCLIASQDLSKLKEAECSLRTKGNLPAGTLFQEEELLPVLTKISRLEAPERN